MFMVFPSFDLFHIIASVFMYMVIIKYINTKKTLVHHGYQNSKAIISIIIQAPNFNSFKKPSVDRLLTLIIKNKFKQARVEYFAL